MTAPSLAGTDLSEAIAETVDCSVSDFDFVSDFALAVRVLDFLDFFFAVVARFFRYVLFFVYVFFLYVLVGLDFAGVFSLYKFR